jgi:hypothetical protein
MATRYGQSGRVTAVGSRAKREGRQLTEDTEARPWRQALWALGALVALAQTVAFRHAIHPDGIAYLNIASNVAQGDWRSLVNGYWSPLYPAVLAGFLRVFRPGMAGEDTVAHVANFAIFLGSFAGFEFFLGSLIAAVGRGRDSAEGKALLPKWAVWAIGDSMFVFFTLLLTQLMRVQADLLLAGCVYVAAGALIRIYGGESGWLSYGFLGAALGVAYLAKAVMFPVSFVFLFCAMFCGEGRWRALLKTAAACAVFAAVSALLIVPLSKEKGKLTYGSTGAINYAEFVDGAPRYVHWEGWPAATGKPVHPARLLMARPPVYEFATPIGGWYPPWYDPSYWYEGIVPAFKLGNQLRAVRYTIEEYVSILPYMAAVLCGWLALAFVSGSRDWVVVFVKKWPIWLGSAAALGLYALVYIESRFTVPFFCIIWAAAFVSLEFPKSEGARSAVRSIALAIVLCMAVGTLWLGARALFRVASPEPFTDLQVAQDLRGMGVGPGERVASIGYGINAFWAQLAGVRIVAEIPLDGAPAFWQSSAATQSEILMDFRNAGATIVVTDQPSAAMPDGWQVLSGTDYYCYRLDAQAGAAGTARPR